MKIRTDFVTNSSSSSFVIAFDDKDSTLSTIFEAIRLAENGDETSRGRYTTITSEEELFDLLTYGEEFTDENLKEQLENENFKKYWEKRDNILNKDWKILEKNIEYGDSLSDLLSELAKAKMDGVVIIDNDE